MGFPLVGVVVATILLVYYWTKGKSSKPDNLKEIPGPRGLPFLGNVLQLGKYPNHQLCKWSKQYGDIFKVKFGKITTVVISNPKWTKEIFSGDPVFTGKPAFEGFDIYEEHPKFGIINSEGEMWEAHRRFLLRQLRDFGFGKSAMEARIMDEVNEVLERFKKQEGEPVGEIRRTLRLALVNSIWTILTSKRFQQDDPELTNLATNTTESFNEILEKGGLLLFIPELRHYFPDMSGYTNARNLIEENKRMFEKTVRDHKEAFQEDNLRDFIDVYLAEVKKTTDAKSPFYGESAEKFLVATLFDLFLAGSDTTATTLAWTILYLSYFPETQKKLQQEISEITGNSRQVSVADRPNMPYTNALLDEIMRWSSIVPDGVQHRAMADREFHGYHVPKDVWIQPNLYYIHHDPKIWGDPENFRPERFLSKDGKKYVKSENLQAFQIGRRQCAGETLARDSLFLYLTNVFQRFSIQLDPNTKTPSINEEEIGFLRAPLPYKVIMKERV